ncbi:(Fe-S)-binding protein [Kitasatospora sp. NPDC057965]|uniref:(Fe-S)-binding protein n=1 Tax=Kitasatospora sp. NPDC057965 TaxID=3346291 RepID=UPI0036D97ACC
MRVALFATCVNDALLPSTAIATVRLLERLGVEVGFPPAQSCCGQPQYNSGYIRACEPLVRRTVRAFAGYDHVVAPSGSCVAMVRDAHPRIAARAGGALAADVAELTPRVHELTEFLTDVLGVEDVGAWFPHTVTYHPSCHGLRLLGLGDRPLRLLRAVRALELVELPGAEECCGFGGTFAVKNPAVSAAMAADKTANALATGAEVLCGGDNSCLLHLGGTLARQGARLRPLHLAEILASTEADPWRAAS